ncbi:cellulase family glycosylhydrolase [Halocatena marina]|uniref:cellulase family glycosylhydrolase n=1 Tax=Halocatena marina TaxID=2934937 RepID=UPI00200F10A4|nr:cellulase family glycosylhydrolase [Halocatena marina]
MSGNTERNRTNESTRIRSKVQNWSTSRRNFLRAAVAAGGLASGFSSVAVNDAAAAGIPTPWLHRDGNLIKDPDGNTVTLRGVNIADPKRIDVTAPARGMTAVQVIDMLTNESNGWYPRMIRLPVQPVDIGEYEPGSGPPIPAFDQSQLESYLNDHLDAAVQRCAERGVYCIIDYHRHRDVQWAEGQSGPVNTALQDEVNMFWDIVAPRYADQSHVLYEVYNEPQEPGMWNDPTTTEWVADIWRLWLDMAQPWVDTIRSHADNLILMGSPSWSQSPEGALVEEFSGSDIAYTYHVYPGHNVSAESCHCWDDATVNGEGVAQVYEQAPLFVTEFGWEQNAGRYIGGTDTFGNAFLDWLGQSDAIHWTAWVADPVWQPVMFDRPFADNADDSVGDPYNGTVPEDCPNVPCEWSLNTGSGFMGDTIKTTLSNLRNDGVPGSGGGGGDTTAPTAPSNLSVTETTSSSVTVSWDGSTDSGGSGLAHYAVSVDGSQNQTVSAGTTSTTVDSLASETSYEIGVTAVDGAGNTSGAVTTTAATDGGSTGGLVINDYDGSPAWSSNTNDLGQWCGGGSFQNGGGAVSGDALVLEYNNGGWIQEQINQDISDYTTLVLTAKGASGGEESGIQFEMGGVSTSLSNVTTDSIGTSAADVAVDLESAGVDRSASSLSLRLNFWGAGSSTLSIQELRLE